MRVLAQLAMGILPILAFPVWGQEIRGHFYLEKENYLVGEPIFIVLDLTNAGPEPAQIDGGNCFLSTRLEADSTSQPGEVNLFECSARGYAGSCLGGVVEVRPGEHRKRRYLLEGTFRLTSPGVYPIQARYTLQIYGNDGTYAVVSREEIVFDLEAVLSEGDENGLVSAYRPIVEDLKSPDPIARGLAISAIVQNPPRFLEEVILGLADDAQTAGQSIVGLKRLATPRAKAKLTQLTGATNPDWIRQQAVTALGELGDPSYCQLMLEIGRSGIEYLRPMALEAAGFACEKEALPTLLSLLPNASPPLRWELADALGNTHTREAVPVLISLLVDADENVRRAAADALATLTHRTSKKGISDEASARQTYLDWVRWWSLNGRTTPIYSLRECNGLDPIN